MLFWGGTLEPLARLINEKRVQLAFSPTTIDELLRVIQYPKLHRTAEKLGVPTEALIDKLIAASVVVHPSRRISVVRGDPADNRILEAAVESGATCIISGDKHLLKLKRYEGIPILPPRIFLRHLPNGSSLGA